MLKTELISLFSFDKERETPFWEATNLRSSLSTPLMVVDHVGAQ
jgi:hypothetical protein